MKIETITYKRVRNLGNYQTETLEVTATLEEDDHPVTIADELKEFVYTQLYPPVPANEEDKPAGPNNNPF